MSAMVPSSFLCSVGELAPSRWSVFALCSYFLQADPRIPDHSTLAGFAALCLLSHWNLRLSLIYVSGKQSTEKGILPSGRDLLEPLLPNGRQTRCAVSPCAPMSMLSDRLLHSGPVSSHICLEHPFCFPSKSVKHSG